MKTPRWPRSHVVHRAASLHSLIVALVLGVLALPLLPAPVAASQSTSLPDNVLQSSVRIMTNVLVTPDDSSEDPFVCAYPDDELVDYSTGSGTLITAEGHILTNLHVVEPGRIPRELRNFCEDQAPGGDGDVEFIQIVWLPDEKGQPGEPYRAEIIDASPAREDLAVIRLTTHLDGSSIDEPLPVCRVRGFGFLREPEPIFTIGYPGNAGGISRIVSEGVFSGWADNGYGVPWIFTDATTSGGNSGGTAVNADGLLIGIPTMATYSDCRPGDTNADGQLDEDDTGCIGLGGNFGILIPSNLAREFAAEAIGVDLPVVNAGSTDDATAEATDDPEPTEEATTGGPAIGDITFQGLDPTGAELDTLEGVNQLDGCFDNNTLKHGDPFQVVWTLDGDIVLDSDYAWDDVYDPSACVSIFIDPEDADPYLDPGMYQVTITIQGEDYVSDEVEVSSLAAGTGVTFSGRTAGRETVEAEDGVLTGEIATIYADIAFADMERGAIWQVTLILDDDTVWESDAEAWEGEATGTETLRIRHPELDTFRPGEYDLVVTVDGDEVVTATITIEP